MIGGAFLVGTGGIGAILSSDPSHKRWRPEGLGQTLIGEMGLEAAGGAIAVLFGILALANVAPLILMPIAVMVMGCCSLLGAGGLCFLGLGAARFEGAHRRIAEQTALATTGVGILVGFSAITLGAFSLVGNGLPLLTEVAVIVLGAGLSAEGAALFALTAHPPRA